MPETSIYRLYVSLSVHIRYTHVALALISACHWLSPLLATKSYRFKLVYMHHAGTTFVDRVEEVPPGDMK